ncbi:MULTISPECIES: SPFH domain-containing protein [unclassified Marinobacterium]|jgi:regulator of protease activity HflC (stomatin/prohibitin superfamily)|uniref:SPFH domain-containing protein n=1 Tax=unclassified Marinobacterium TaxID=2644139 RepID=UPI00156948E1|nr:MULTISPECIES: SPFH domain-containing protein [unclassified Marinobacterium]NRP10851.1 Modulator of FtsH protease HflK [Marinobacterium sp. xm-g-48]NRP14868.1 Modulator of FtsH protease HflK [Marinobacterium sp. xm-a-152]NRP27376.1 Modulator of FtsH protease HflK [Marinobacterium sp. xm-d-420]NRP36773.1 Modulator of FtsH protease HflK [Marinobacterium sp. xm-d-579]NRP38598.1 Modulator of FtsH protease HflK [Marinobacterium sp. xm-a-121]
MNGEFLSGGMIVTLAFAIFFLVLAWSAVKVVPQSQVFVVERFGKFSKTLNAGINFIVPMIDQVRHRISILERQLPAFEISVITKDNVEVILEATNFYRITDAARSVYRIQNIDQAIQTTAESIVRSAAGKLDLDELQSSRAQMNEEILTNLQKAAEVWGIEITRTEITDVQVDEQTKEAQRQQLNAERQRRAQVAQAEGQKRSVELNAEAQLYEAQKQAEAVRVAADADAYAIKVKAEATAEQTRMIADAINNGGQSAINFDILQKQVAALSEVAAADNSKTVIMPTDITKAIGSLELLAQTVGDGLKSK